MKSKIEKQNLNKPQHHWLLILRVMWRYLFRSKNTQYYYIIYGSEGHYGTRKKVDNIIKQHGFWCGSWWCIHNAT